MLRNATGVIRTTAEALHNATGVSHNAISVLHSGTRGLHHTNETINNAIDQIEYLKESNKNVDANVFKIILSDLKNSKTGIKNLIETYIDDLIVISNLETIIQSIDFVLEDNEHILQTLQIVKDDITQEPTSV